MNLTELLQARAELKTKIKAANAKIDAYLSLPTGTASAEQTAQAEKDDADAAKLHADLAKLDKRIATAQAEAADDERQAQLETQANVSREDAIRRGRQTRPDTANVGHIPTVPAQARQHDPSRGFSTPREFLTCVSEWSTRGTRDNRLIPLMTVGSDEARGNSDPAGGFLVPEAFLPGVMRLDPEADPLANLITPMPMRSPVVRIPYRVDKNHSSSVSGGFTVSRRPETVAGTASQASLGRMNFTAHELFGLAYATEEILIDSPESFAAMIQAGFQDEFAARLMQERLTGTGVGEFMGVLNSPCLITITKESGQVADTIVKSNIDKMRARCWRYSQAVWLANHNTLVQLKGLVQIVGVGGNAVPYLSNNINGQETLDGRPIFFTEFASTLGNVGDLILGNWSQWLEGTYQPLQQAESMHVRFVNHERAFKFWLRNAGACWWDSVLTPKNGDTLSPFVTLEAR